MSDEDGRPELKPARPEASASGRRPSYAPRLPWKWILIGAVGLGAVFASYFIRREQRQEALREEMLALHRAELGELTERTLGFRHRIEGLIQEAAEAGEPETWVDPRLNISGLRAGDGLYLRMNADWTDTQARIEGSALAMEPDRIATCMGLSPMSLRGLYEKSFFLTPEWVDRVRDEQEMMELRVLDDQLGRHIQVDAPVLLSMMQADWFMLVLQQGENRRDAPVDVYLWDLRRNQQLLRARIQGRGLLVPVRLRFEGVHNPAAPGRPEVRSGGAQDCSIASQIRALTGGDALEFNSGQQVIDTAARADEAAAEEEAAEEEAAADAPSEDAPPSDNAPSDNAPTDEATPADDEGGATEALEESAADPAPG